MKIASPKIPLVLLAGLAAAALFAAGCSLQTSQSERPNWSLNGPKESLPPVAKKYSDGNGPSAPKPLTYNGAQ